MHDAAAAMIPPAPESGTEVAPAHPFRAGKVLRCESIRLVTKNGEVVEYDTAEVEVFMTKPKRGFAALAPEARRAAGAKGGQTSHANGTAHRFTSDSGRAAGSKGGLAPHRTRGRVSGAIRGSTGQVD